MRSARLQLGARSMWAKPRKLPMATDRRGCVVSAAVSTGPVGHSARRLTRHGARALAGTAVVAAMRAAATVAVAAIAVGILNGAALWAITLVIRGIAVSIAIGAGAIAGRPMSIRPVAVIAERQKRRDLRGSRRFLISNQCISPGGAAALCRCASGREVHRAVDHRRCRGWRCRGHRADDPAAVRGKIRW